MTDYHPNHFGPGDSANLSVRCSNRITCGLAGAIHSKTYGK